MTRTLLAALALTACAPELDDATDLPAEVVEGEQPWFDAPPADHPLPPPLPQGMTLSTDPLVPGDTTLLTVTGATPGDPVIFMRGNVPGSTCPPPLGGGCLDLGAPKQLGSATANALGEATLAISLPVTVPVGASLNLQAVATSASPYVSQVLQASTEAVCGDLILQSTEDCDDGNDLPDDGCSDLCLVEFCGDGVVQASEECDDGNTAIGDGCDDLCLAELTDDFEIHVDRVTLLALNPANNDDWDFDPFGIFVDPDVYYIAWVDAVPVYQSNVASDTRFATFNDTFQVTVTAGSTLFIDVWDEDVVGSDYVGTLQYEHGDLNALIDTGPFTDAHAGIQTATLEVLTP